VFADNKIKKRLRYCDDILSGRSSYESKTRLTGRVSWSLAGPLSACACQAAYAAAAALSEALARPSETQGLSLDQGI
jgi:hypothetical protein